MTTKQKTARAARPKKKDTISASAEQIVNGVAGLVRLIKLPVPIEVGTEWRKGLQALRFAAKPLEDAREDLVMTYAVKKKGQPVYETATSVKLDPARVGKFNELYKRWAEQKHEVAMVPLSLADIPRKVNGRDLVIEPEVFELLGPFLVD